MVLPTDLYWNCNEPAQGVAASSAPANEAKALAAAAALKIWQVGLTTFASRHPLQKVGRTSNGVRK